jgi:hypothetical protein
VTVTDQLDKNLDWNTFALTEVGFGDTHIPIPAGSQHFQTTVDTTENGQTFQVQIELGINASTGQVFATFYSIDPATGLPPDVLTGFLPPEDGTGRGMGYFSYLVQPAAGLATATQIRNVAVITFDPNPPIATDQVDDHDPTKGTDANKEALVTIDSGPPASSVNPLPASSPSTFTVSWSGSDDPGGSGIGSYDIYVSDNGGDFTPFLTGTTQTSASFSGQDGHTYAFYSVATDNVGNREETPTTAQTSTLVDTVAPTSSVSALPPLTGSASFLVRWGGFDNAGGSGLASFDVFVSTDGGSFTGFVQGTTQTAAIFSGAVGHTYAFYSVATDNVGNREATPALAQAATQTVNPNTSTTLAASRAAPVFGQPVTFTAVVQALRPATGKPAGMVTFLEGATVLGTAPLHVVHGVDRAMFTTAALGLNSHTITAVYDGQGTQRTTSTSAPVTVTVGPAHTRTLLHEVPRSSVFGQPVILTAVVRPVGPSAGTPPGSMTFRDGTTDLGTVPVQVVDGVDEAILTTAALGVGKHRLTAVYADTADGDFLGSTAAAVSA